MRLLKSTAIIGALTLVSRVMGLVRDILIARFLGAGGISDAFFTAFKLPNLFRRMFAEGAFNAAFIPLYARRIEEEGQESADAFASESMAALFTAVAAIIIIFEITMPWSLSLIGYGLDRAVDPVTGVSPYYLAVLYAQITMPYLIFMSMTALFSGVLNTKNYFALAAGVPIVLNVFMISTLAWLGISGAPQNIIALGLSAAITVSGLVQMGLVIWGCRRAGIRIGLRRPRLTPGVKRLFILGVPGLLSAGITQINLLVSHSIATLRESAASWLTYADRLYQLPLGMIGIAMGVALLPSLARALRSGNEAEAKDQLNRAIEIAMFFTLPAAFALAMIPEFLISGLYERGAFVADTTVQTAKALRMFAYGLPAFVLIKVLTPAFFARENTKTPMKFAALSALINIVLGVALFFSMGFQGLALATSVAAWTNVICLLWVLMGQGHCAPDARLISRLPRVFIASALMGTALLWLARYAETFLARHFILDAAALVAVCAAGLCIYAAAAGLLRAFSMNDIRGVFKRKAG